VGVRADEGPLEAWEEHDLGGWTARSVRGGGLWMRGALGAMEESHAQGGRGPGWPQEGLVVTYMADLRPRPAHIGIQEADRPREGPILDLDDLFIGGGPLSAAHSSLADRTSFQDDRENDRAAVLATPDVEMLGEVLVLAKRSEGHVVEQFGVG